VELLPWIYTFSMARVGNKWLNVVSFQQKVDDESMVVVN
jgi:hypothetical protein